MIVAWLYICTLPGRNYCYLISGQEKKYKNHYVEGENVTKQLQIWEAEFESLE